MNYRIVFDIVGIYILIGAATIVMPLRNKIYPQWKINKLRFFLLLILGMTAWPFIFYSAFSELGDHKNVRK